MSNEPKKEEVKKPVYKVVVPKTFKLKTKDFEDLVTKSEAEFLKAL